MGMRKVRRKREREVSTRNGKEGKGCRIGREGKARMIHRETRGKEKNKYENNLMEEKEIRSKEGRNIGNAAGKKRERNESQNDEATQEGKRKSAKNA